MIPPRLPRSTPPLGVDSKLSWLPMYTVPSATVGDDC
ncbi:hypothetical protein RKD20_008886 [Streptomyces sp. SLBN-8D4]|jgi:hypothetical protein